MPTLRLGCKVDLGAENIERKGKTMDSIKATGTITVTVVTLDDRVVEVAREQRVFEGVDDAVEQLQQAALIAAREYEDEAYHVEASTEAYGGRAVALHDEGDGFVPVG